MNNYWGEGGGGLETCQGKIIIIKLHSPSLIWKNYFSPLRLRHPDKYLYETSKPSFYMIYANICFIYLCKYLSNMLATSTVNTIQ